MESTGEAGTAGCLTVVGFVLVWPMECDDGDVFQVELECITVDILVYFLQRF